MTDDINPDFVPDGDLDEEVPENELEAGDEGVGDYGNV